ncbi:MAG TPA: 3-oxoacyl-ACP reductase FabG [Burkholderiaceae bacterium]|nr:3-oxoacyl-ACP reductase FabG [Burkholderiaceae bacterium]HYA75428.1 3-oxoacyl-ACP reductase FabG [Burkholderiaceae bacterium]
MNEASVFAADALRGEVALITGASRGIGRAILECLAQAGANVVGTATSEAGAQGISQRLQELGAGGCGLVVNVRDRAGCDALVEQVAARFGKLSILVNNAGITADTLAMRMRDEDWDAVIDTNLTAAFRLARACMRGMMKGKWGRVINISSVVGSSGNAGQANYAAAKAGLEGMTRALARELGGRNITVNCVAPGFIDTDMTRALTQQQQQALLGQIPLGRLGHASEVAAAVLFLASAAGAYITGATLHVNGGMYMD